MRYGPVRRHGAKERVGKWFGRRSLREHKRFGVPCSLLAEADFVMVSPVTSKVGPSYVLHDLRPLFHTCGAVLLSLCHACSDILAASESSTDTLVNAHDIFVQ